MNVPEEDDIETLAGHTVVLIKARDLRLMLAEASGEKDHPDDDTHEALRAKVKRLESTIKQMLYDDERICEEAVDHVCGECHGCLLRENPEALMSDEDKAESTEEADALMACLPPDAPARENGDSDG